MSAAGPAAASRVVIHCTLGSSLDVITKLLAVPPHHRAAPYVRSGQSVHVLPAPAVQITSQACGEKAVQ